MVVLPKFGSTTDENPEGTRKGAEVPDLNALKLCETRGFSGQFHTKSMFIGQNKYIFGQFGGNVGTINTSTQSGVLISR